MNLGGNESDWEIIDGGETFRESVQRCGGPQLVAEILAPVEYALRRNPFGFAKIGSYSTLWLAKTKLRIRRLEVLPACRMWFTVDASARRVCKLFVEFSSPEDMALSDDLWEA
jgi:hypothetical protein